MKIFVICDMEGVGGVIDHRSQCWSDGAFFQQARSIATAELNALIEGAIDGGATEIVAWDGHCGYPGMLDLEHLHKDCRVIIGAADGGPVGLDESFDAVFQFGLHAMSGTPGAVLAHSFTPFIQDLHLNGRKIGEIGMNCAIAGSLGVPCVFVSGDKAAVLEARTLVPEIEGVTVKEALLESVTGIQTAPTAAMSVTQSCSRIREGAKAAVKKCFAIKPYVVEPPYTFQIRYSGAEHAQALSARPSVRCIDERTFEYSAESLMDFAL
jgi:D-amino peptidase